MKGPLGFKNKDSQAYKTLCSLLQESFGYQKLDFEKQQYIERLRDVRKGGVVTESDTPNVNMNPFCDEATLSVRRITRHIARVLPLRQAAALSEIDPADTDQLKNFISERLPDYQDNLMKSLAGATAEALFGLSSTVSNTRTCLCLQLLRL